VICLPGHEPVSGCEPPYPRWLPDAGPDAPESDGDLTGTVIGIQGVGFLRNGTRRLIIGRYHSSAQALFTFI